MTRKRLVLGVACPLVTALALLVLVRFRIARVVGWPLRGDRAGNGGRPRGRSAAGAPADGGRRGGPAGIGRFRPWRPITGAGSLLAQRDPSGEQEWMDLPGRDPRELAAMFKDLRRVNRWLGGRWTTVRGLERLIGGRDPGEPITILDVASGSVDIPRVMAGWARRRGRDVSIVATDINPEVLKLAKDLGCPDAIRFVAADALRLPFADGAFDVAASSFFLHHLDPDGVVTALREMRRVARGGVLINDLVRGRISYLGAWALSRAFTRNRISRHDAPLSARRSYTRAELVELAARAGLEPVACYGFFGYRVVLVAVDRRTATAPEPPTVSAALATTT